MLSTRFARSFTRLFLLFARSFTRLVTRFARASTMLSTNSFIMLSTRFGRLFKRLFTRSARSFTILVMRFARSSTMQSTRFTYSPMVLIHAGWIFGHFSFLFFSFFWPISKTHHQCTKMVLIRQRSPRASFWCIKMNFWSTKVFDDFVLFGALIHHQWCYWAF